MKTKLLILVLAGVVLGGCASTDYRIDCLSYDPSHPCIPPFTQQTSLPTAR